MISSMPWTVDSSWQGWRALTLSLRTNCSWILGLYFIVQVPRPMSMFRSVPIVSWERRRK